MLYCTKEDLYEACLSNAVNEWASDSPDDSKSQVNAKIKAAISRASEEINLYISKHYTLPIAFVPVSLRDICVKLSLYQLMSRKGFDPSSADSSIKLNYDSAVKQLEQIAYGRLDIGIKKDSAQKSVVFYRFAGSPVLKRGV